MGRRIQLPRPMGPHSIGVMDFELEDEEREESYAPGSKRRIPVRAWYPALAGTGATRPNTKPAELRHQVIPLLKRIAAATDITALLDVPTHAYENAPPLPGGRCPVLIFSHGAFACPQVNTALLEHLASYGYIIFSISHPYLDSATIHENGDIILADRTLIEDMMARSRAPERLAALTASDAGQRLEATLANCHEFRLSAQFLVWEGDFIHVVDRLHQRDLPARALPLLDIVDLDRLGTFGVSFGGAGAAAAQRDSRIKATVNLDGTVLDAEMIDRNSRVPMLMLHQQTPTLSSGASGYPHSEFAYETIAAAGTRADVIRLEVQGASHSAFSDFCLLPPELRADPALAPLVGSIKGERMIAIMNDFCKAFFDYHLSEEGSGIDPALRAKYPEVSDIDLTYLRAWAASNTPPGFMSYRHTQLMNRLLADNAETKAITAHLTRRHVLAYELANGPTGATVWWQMRFDPAAGVSFTLTRPESPADLTLTGDWREAMQDFVALRDRKREVAPRLRPVGDEGVMATIGEAFAAARKAAAVPATMPDV